ncbi:MAG TPA: AMP-binding protein, partial [Thermoanaerobaculia bacterium]|nr:AMP-binding protein [Thermoanaerobaculia bacterium]
MTPTARLSDWARRTPREIAFRSPTEEWTFDALDRRASAIAGVATAGTPGDRVAFLTGSEGEAVAALIGAIRARRAAVPLDPAQPTARLARIVQSSGAAVVLASPALLELARAIAGGAAVASLDAPEGGPPNPGLEATPDDLAVLLFTSGSTGAPKGIGRTVGMLAASAAAHGAEFALGPSDRILLLGPVTFSANVSQILSALWAGASIRAFPVEREGLSGLAAWMRGERVTIAHFVPTLFRRFASVLGEDDAFPDLRLLRLSGETIHAADIALWRRHFSPASRLSLSFATTEAGRVCARTIEFDEPVPDTAVANGWPVPGVRVDLLDEEGRPVPDGEAGEIVVSSPAVLREYWNDPALTARTVAPVAGDPAARSHRTGDVGRWTKDGLVHLGRKDLEIKIRGMRVHLSEVEAALGSVPGLGEVAAAGRPDETGGVRLVAYVAGEPESLPPRSEIRRRLRERLAEAAVPAAFVVLPEIPRTSTGKVDRLSLPEPGPGDYAEPRDPVAPRDRLEERLAEIWRRVLPARVESVHESFFDLGGDSLRAAEMLAAVEAELGRRLPLPLLLDASTIAALADTLRDPAAARDDAATLVALRATGTRLPLFCVPGGNGPGFNYRTIARLLGDDQPFYAFHVLTEAGRPLPGTIEAWAKTFLAELRRVQPNGPYRLGGHSFGGTVAGEMARRLVSAGENVEVLALFDTFAPGYPPAAPPARRAAGLWRRFRALRWSERAATAKA